MEMFRTLPSSFDPSLPGPRALIAVGVEWCGYCSQFKPELKGWESRLRSTRVYWVDGDTDARAKRWGADGYPTVLYHASGGGLYKYGGQRTLEGIQRFIASIES
jgi:hypothetical protein